MKRTRNAAVSFRLYSDVLKGLLEESQRREISLSALVNSVLENYVDFGRFAQRYGILRISPTTITTIMNQLSYEDVERVAREIGKSHPKEFLASLGLEYTIQNLSKLMSEYLGKHSQWFEEKITEEPNGLLVHLRHRLDRRWSLFLKQYVATILEGFGYRERESTLTDYSASIRLNRVKKQ